MYSLSKRLKLIASLVPSGARVCDIGADHGYLSIALSNRGNVKTVIAADINEKPLKIAEKNINNADAQGIDLRLGDGLSVVHSDEVDTVVIAGIGGEVIAGILKNGKNVAARHDITLILQPTTSADLLRLFLCENGYEIISETPIFENEKLYSVMLCKFCGKPLPCSLLFRFIGKISADTEEGIMYIKKQLNRCYKTKKALENIPKKAEDFLFYKAVCEEISNYLNSKE